LAKPANQEKGGGDREKRGGGISGAQGDSSLLIKDCAKRRSSLYLNKNQPLEQNARGARFRKGKFGGEKEVRSTGEKRTFDGKEVLADIDSGGAVIGF